MVSVYITISLQSTFNVYHQWCTRSCCRRDRMCVQVTISGTARAHLSAESQHARIRKSPGAMGCYSNQLMLLLTILFNNIYAQQTERRPNHMILARMCIPFRLPSNSSASGSAPSQCTCGHQGEPFFKSPSTKARWTAGNVPNSSSSFRATRSEIDGMHMSWRTQHVSSSASRLRLDRWHTWEAAALFHEMTYHRRGLLQVHRSKHV